MGMYRCEESVYVRTESRTSLPVVDREGSPLSRARAVRLNVVSSVTSRTLEVRVITPVSLSNSRKGLSEEKLGTQGCKMNFTILTSQCIPRL